MKYTLFLGIEFQAYKSPANLEVSVGGRFIDTFSLTDDLPSKNTLIQLTAKDKSMLGKLRETPVDRHRSEHHWGLDPDWIELEVSVPTFYKIYQLDDKDLKGSVEISVVNSNNNYTNGFMTKDSRVRISLASLLPSHLLNDNGHALMATTTKLLKGVGKYEHRHGAMCTFDLPHDNPPENLNEYYSYALKVRPKQYEKGIDRILTAEKRLTQSHYYGRHCWPLAGLFYVKRASAKYEKSGVRDHRWWIGGNGTVCFPIRKKHKTKYIGSWGHQEIGFVFAITQFQNSILGACKHLINIYNEDQRSNNT